MTEVKAPASNGSGNQMPRHALDLVPVTNITLTREHEGSGSVRAIIQSAIEEAGIGDMKSLYFRPTSTSGILLAIGTTEEVDGRSAKDARSISYVSTGSGEVARIRFPPDKLRTVLNIDPDDVPTSAENAPRLEVLAAKNAPVLGFRVPAPETVAVETSSDDDPVEALLSEYLE